MWRKLLLAGAIAVAGFSLSGCVDGAYYYDDYAYPSGGYAVYGPDYTGYRGGYYGGYYSPGYYGGGYVGGATVIYRDHGRRYYRDRHHGRHYSGHRPGRPHRVSNQHGHRHGSPGYQRGGRGDHAGDHQGRGDHRRGGDRNDWRDHGNRLTDAATHRAAACKVEEAAVWA